MSEPLYFRRFRRVIGLLLMDHIRTQSGYFCNPCRKAMFFQWQGSTLVFGWWGVFAMLFRNPYAIGVNFKALFRPPFHAEQHGAVTLAGLGEAATGEARQPEGSSA